MHFFRFSAPIFLTLSVFIGCSSSEEITTEIPTSSASSVYPEWFDNLLFSADSTSYSGFATAIAADSATAIQRAETAARVNLEKEIGKFTEEIRASLEESGSSQAGNTDFIIILRSAHAAVEGAAKRTEALSNQMDSNYRGFVSVSITRNELVKVLEKGFTGHPRYWGEFSSAELFAEYFE